MACLLQFMDKSTFHSKLKGYISIYGVPISSVRGGHAHLKLYQLLVATTGTFEIILYDGIDRKRIKIIKAKSSTSNTTYDLERHGKFLN